MQLRDVGAAEIEEFDGELLTVEAHFKVVELFITE